MEQKAPLLTNTACRCIARKPKMAVITLLAAMLVMAGATGCTFTGGKAAEDFIISYADDVSAEADLRSAVQTYLLTHANILKELAADDSFVSGADIWSITPKKTNEAESGLPVYEVVYYLTCKDPAAVILLQDLAESPEFTEKWQEEGRNGGVPVLENPIHCGFRAEIIVP